jgi:hypothetical protein
VGVGLVIVGLAGLFVGEGLVDVPVEPVAVDPVEPVEPVELLELLCA